LLGWFQVAGIVKLKFDLLDVGLLINFVFLGVLGGLGG
jgi:hypothetical protein